MTNNRSPELTTIDGWPFRISKAAVQTKPARVLLLLHGHLGNENVMWIFSKQIPENFTILSPRAPEKLGPEQFSWHKIGPRWPDLQKYQDLSNELLTRVNFWLEENDIHADQLDLLGFSQGAVMAYALAISKPDKIGRVGALAGFIPNSWKKKTNPVNLAEQKFFVAHGNQDDIVPIRKAYQAKEWLQKHGASVEFCEADVGHKLSANCFSGLETFFR